MDDAIRFVNDRPRPLALYYFDDDGGRAVAESVDGIFVHADAGEPGELTQRHLSLFSLLGICVMLSANNFLVVYLGLELMSLSLYALIALRRDHAVSTEAAMKYFVLGALDRKSVV